MKNPPLLIFGCGAMACFFAARLVSCGIETVLTDEWTEGLRVIQKKGITLETKNQNNTYPIKILIPDEKSGFFKHALVLLKSWQTGWAAESLSQRLEPDGCVLTLQNGLGNDSALKKLWNENKVLSGITTLGATQLSPGFIRAFEDGSISLENKPASEEFMNLFLQAGLPCKIEKDIESLVWGKLLINAVINPLTALMDQPNGWLMENPQADEMMEPVIQEITNLTNHLGISLPFDDPLSEIKKVSKNTSPNSSSMLQDLRRQAPTEIDQINGAIARLGIKNGIPTPVNQTLTSLVKLKLQSIK